jgi:TRAP-type transport system periplasmic protein
MRKSGLATVLVAALAAGSAMAQEVTLKIHHFLPPTSPAHARFMKPWADKVMAESNGKLKIDLFPAMQLGGAPPQLYDQVRDGVADIVWTLPGYTAGRFPIIEAFELPFMVSTAEATSQAVHEYAMKHSKNEFRDVHPLAFWTHAPGVFHSGNKPIKSMDDLKGMKIRFPTRQMGEALKALGATPVGMPVPAAPEALSKGVIDALVVPWEVVPSLRIHELTKSHTEVTGERGLYTSVFLYAMNKRKYEGLPADVKKVIDDNSGAALAKQLGKLWDEVEAPGRQAALQRGNSIEQLAPEEIARFRKATEGVSKAWIADVSKKGVDGRKLYEEANALITKYARMN